MTPTAKSSEFELEAAAPGHVAELGRILFEAFKGLHESHGYPLEYPTEAMGRQTIFMLVNRKDYYGVTALLDGQPVGSAFLLRSDEVGGIGPVTVSPAVQGRGIARALMEDLIAQAGRQGLTRIRLMQEACNTHSLALYASVGLEAREEVAYMQAHAAEKPDPFIRPATVEDLAVIDELSVRLYGVSRRNEVAAALRRGSAPLIRLKDGKATGYLLAGINGHGVAETDDDAISLTGEMARRQPASNARFFCPLSEASLLRKTLKAGSRIIKVWTLMAQGPYETPPLVWMPSSTY